MVRFALAIVFGWCALALCPSTVLAQLPPQVLIDAAQQTEPAPATQPIVNVTVNTTDPTAATSPTTQPDDGNESLLDALSNTDLGRMVRGEKKIELTELKNYEFWVSLLWDLVKTIFGFVPRVIACVIFLAVFYLLYRGVRRLATR